MVSTNQWLGWYFDMVSRAGSPSDWGNHMSCAENGQDTLPFLRSQCVDMRFILKRDDRMQTCYSHCTLKFWQDYIKKLERDRLESDLKEAHDVLANMGNRLQALERNPSVWGLLGFDSTCKSFIFRDGNQWLS